MHKKILGELRLHEKKVLRTLIEKGGKASIEEISKTSGLDQVAVMRAFLVLKEKGLADLHEKKLYKIEKTLVYHELPERSLIRGLGTLGGKTTLDQLTKKTGLTPEKVSIAVGWAKKKGWINLQKEKGNLLVLTPQGWEALKKPGSDEELLTKLDKKSITVENIETDAIASLKRRKDVIKIKELVQRTIVLSSKAMEIKAESIPLQEEITQLTPQLIASGEWRNKTFQRYNLLAPIEPIYPGKAHPLRLLLKRIRHIFLEMGFIELKGPIVDTSFWPLDALFIPQDHPARDMQDTFYIRGEGVLPQKELVERVAKTHQDGWKTGSKGWGYTWNPKTAKELILRTHTTSVSARSMAKISPPTRIFCVDKVFRNETPTYKNLPEFYQVEGIVVDKNATFTGLLGYLDVFCKKMGLKVGFRPGYFPYTEPSVEPEIYLEEKKTWIEVGGAGMFRPEVVEPLLG
ncbi:MAG: phenylalanine--tRNA ligase subunit alpha, partial [Methanobacteriota archaeon]